MMSESTTILTPNRRLAATLRKHFHVLEQSSRECWPTPDILPISSWLQRLWLENSFSEDTPCVLNSAQEQYIWEAILRQSKESNQLLQLAEAADLTKSAWGLLKQWLINHDHPLLINDDAAPLRQWCRAFEKICKQSNLIDLPSVTDRLTVKITNNEINLPKEIKLIGFTEITPQVNCLLDTCKTKGVNVELLSANQLTEKWMDKSTQTQKRITLETNDNEILLMARWAQSIYNKDNQATIGCVIPNLEKNRERVKQIFHNVFSNDHLFNISAGKRLNEFPIIYAALQLLSINQSVKREILNYLLTSPFIGKAENERLRRAFADRLLKDQHSTQIKLDQCDVIAKHCKQFYKLYNNYQNLLIQYSDKTHYSNWACRISELLTAWGWPGERSLNSEEYQTVEAWQRALYTLATLDYVAPPVTLQEALHALRRIVKSTIFQPKSPDANIQILGLLEAAGSPFDYLWIAGMDDLTWPPPPNPHPFIPKPIQRELQMPHATAERELMFCHSLLQQFKENARSIIFSYAKESRDTDCQVSPLISHLPEITIDDLNLLPYTAPYQQLFQSARIELFTDNQAPSLKNSKEIQGGVGIIKNQALCAFKAFSEYRLNARDQDDTAFGLRKKDRGELIHKAMEVIWNKLADQATLIKVESEQLQVMIDDSIEEAFKLVTLPCIDYPHYLHLERLRLKKLMGRWLDIEKARSPFKVLHNEKKSAIQLGQLTLSVRIDRIDELENGKILIIDYKTGKTNHPNSWLGDRPDEPQLPLYALLDSEKTLGVAFAQLYPGKYGFSGLSQYDLDIKGIKPLDGWDGQLTEWHTVLNKLSDDFYQGIATVNPKEEEQTCQWCALKGLCRVNEEDQHEHAISNA